MSRSLIQTVNAGPQTVPELGVIGLGSTTRRFGCNCRQSGDAIECAGCGYYTVTASVIASPDAVGVVSVQMPNTSTIIPPFVRVFTKPFTISPLL